MPIYPGSIWEPISLAGGGSNGPMTEFLGVALHVNAAESEDLFNWCNNGAHDMSCHFQVAKDGRLWQYIDTSTSSWCQTDGNNTYLSVETQGFPTEPLTPQQVTAIAGLYRWVAEVHGVPYQLAERVGDRGFGWHGMGGNSWGGHSGCPGDLRKAQRTEILALAQGNPLEDDMTPEQAKDFETMKAQVAYIFSNMRASTIYGTTGPGATAHHEAVNVDATLAQLKILTDEVARIGVPAS